MAGQIKVGKAAEYIADIVAIGQIDGATEFESHWNGFLRDYPLYSISFCVNGKKWKLDFPIDEKKYAGKNDAWMDSATDHENIIESRTTLNGVACFCSVCDGDFLFDDVDSFDFYEKNGKFVAIE